MDQYDFDALKARVAELEDKIKFLYRRLNIEYMEGDPTQAVNAKVCELLQRGNKIEAIKGYRGEVYNVGLTEAKHAIDSIEQGIQRGCVSFQLKPCNTQYGFLSTHLPALGRRHT